MFWVLFCASLVLFCGQTIQAFGIVAFHAEFFEKKPTIVVDAGHGGEDGGAVGVNGLVEKDVNLAIALALAEDLKAANFPVVLVREGDYSVGDQSLGTIAERKRSDTKSRAQLVEETGECVLISIHQNQYPDPSVRGAQVFYTLGDVGRQWGEYTQQMLQETVDSSNTKKAKQVSEDVYLFSHISCPGLLVECGFLSNGLEASLLLTDGYQTRLSMAITGAYLHQMQMINRASGGI